MTEDEARRVLLLRAVEADAPGALWSADDRAWATRAARDAPPERFLADRAHHAMQRLAPRDAGLARWLQRRTWRAAWPLVAAVLGFVLGAAIDVIGSGQRIELLSPPLLGVLLWNAAVYGLIAVGAFGTARGLRGLLRRALADPAAGSGPVPRASAAWADIGAPLHAARVAVLLHLAAAALGAGLVAGLYARGLVLDYRAGWQSTFLEPAQVHAVLATLLAPASALTGRAVPGVEALAAMRVMPGEPAREGAALWIHLFAATLALAVIVPRLLLAAAAALRARRFAQAVPLPLQEAYFVRLQRAHRGEPASVNVLPHVVPPSPEAEAALRRALAVVFGEAVRVRIAPPVPFGDEDTPPPASEPATLRIVMFEATATPEPEHHGSLLAALGAGVPRLAVVDEAAFARRFATLPQRRDERRAAWRRLAIAAGVRLVAADLSASDDAALATEIEAALGA